MSPAERARRIRQGRERAAQEKLRRQMAEIDRKRPFCDETDIQTIFAAAARVPAQGKGKGNQGAQQDRKA